MDLLVPSFTVSLFQGQDWTQAIKSRSTREMDSEHLLMKIVWCDRKFHNSPSHGCFQHQEWALEQL